MVAIVRRPRSTITDTPEGLRIDIAAGPLRRTFLGFVGTWLAFWNLAALAAALRLVPGESGEVATGWRFALVWLVGDAMALPPFLWYLGGRQVIRIDGRTLTIRREVFGIGRSRSYDLGGIRELRASSEGLEDGSSVAFDHEGRRRRFGAFLPEAEAEHLVGAIRARFDLPDDPGQRTDPT